MNILDLGLLTGKIVVFGGPHGNLQALEALLDGPAADAATVISTGDLVAYCADGAAVVEKVREARVFVVAGNCEKQLAAGADDCGCGFSAGSTCSHLSRAWYAHALASLSTADRAWLGARPDIIRFEWNGRRFAVIHGGLTDISRFLWPVSLNAEFADELTAIEAASGPFDDVIAGHSGISFSRDLGSHTWTNAGALGVPENDGSTSVRFLELGPEGLVIRSLDYDHTAAWRAMVKANLVQGYHDALLTGYWPSEEVLPHNLRREMLPEVS